MQRIAIYYITVKSGILFCGIDKIKSFLIHTIFMQTLLKMLKMKNYVSSNPHNFLFVTDEVKTAV